MSRRVATTGSKRRRNITLLWVAGLAVLVITLLYLQQVAVLYVIATLGVTVLLVVVALSDLSGGQKSATEPVPADDAAAISSGITAATTASATTSSARRASKRR